MEISTYEVMYIQAKDNYPYNVDECIEKLHYVIAADSEHTGAQFLMGKIYEEQLEDYKQAEYYYRMALYLDKSYLPAYYQYAEMLINLNRIDEALKIIGLGKTVPGADMARLGCLSGSLYEKYEMYSTAIDRYTDAKKAAMNTYYMESMDDHIKRVKDKQRLDKRYRKKEAKAKKEKKAS